MANQKVDSGSLTKVNNLILSSQKSSVFTLKHWSDNNESQLYSSPAKACSRYRLSRTNNKARLLFVRFQESALNFLVRWALLDNDHNQTNEINKFSRTKSNNYKKKIVKDNKKIEYFFRNEKSTSIDSNEDGDCSPEDKRTRSSLILYKVAKLPDRSLKSILKFIFFRWLTLTNALEFILIIVLLAGCFYHCYEPIEEYRKYPTFISVAKIMNDNFRKDLPGITICNKNIISKETLRLKFPDYNMSHYLAISFDTFYSIDNYSIPTYLDILSNEIELVGPEELDQNRFNYNSQIDSTNTSSLIPPAAPPPSTTTITTPSLLSQQQFDTVHSPLSAVNESLINWSKVVKFLTGDKPAGTFNIIPSYDMIDNLVCANIWGDHISCDKLKKIQSIQDGSSCVTLFHDSIFYDEKSPGVRELNSELKDQKIDEVKFADNIYDGDDSGLDIIEFNDDNNNDENKFYLEDDNDGQFKSGDELKEQVTMNTREVIRIKLNFRDSDYMDNGVKPSGMISIHSNSHIGDMSHVNYNLVPGFWYNYYIERFDFKRLPAPYNSNCYNYTKYTSVWTKKTKELWSNIKEVHNIIYKQVQSMGKLLPEYAKSVRERSIGSVSVFIYLIYIRVKSREFFLNLIINNRN